MEAMKGSVVLGRYKVIDYLDQGSFGYIFTVSDLKNEIQTDQDLVIKVGEDIQGYMEEVVTLIKLDVVQKHV